MVKLIITDPPDPEVDPFHGIAMASCTDKQNFSTGEKKLVNATSSHLDGGVRCIFLMEFVVGFWQLEDLAEMILLLLGFLVFHKKYGRRRNYRKNRAFC